MTIKSAVNPLALHRALWPFTFVCKAFNYIKKYRSYTDFPYACMLADTNIHFSLELWQPRIYVIGRPLLKHGHLWKNQMSCAYNTHLLNLLSWIVNVIPNIFLVLIFCYTIFCEVIISKETRQKFPEYKVQYQIHFLLVLIFCQIIFLWNENFER